MASPKAPLLGTEGKQSKTVALQGDVFAAELKPHLVHEAVRAELNARRAGTRGAKSRGLVAGGRGKPWRQKGIGRARAGTIRAPQFTGGGVAFPPTARNFEVKVNRKAYRSALRGALSAHAEGASLAILEEDAFTEPSTRRALELLASWEQERPLLVIALPGEESLIKSFRNLERVRVTVPAALEVTELTWARSLLVSAAALEQIERRAGVSNGD